MKETLAKLTGGNDGGGGVWCWQAGGRSISSPTEFAGWGGAAEIGSGGVGSGEMGAGNSGVSPMGNSGVSPVGNSGVSPENSGVSPVGNSSVSPGNSGHRREGLFPDGVFIPEDTSTHL